jgi:predicted nucleic acid-binding protein
MGFRFSDEADKDIIKDLLNSFEMINIVPGIAENVISIRQQKKMKLPDAIILATAKFMDCDLLTRNVNDFLNIEEEANIVNPFERPQSQEDEEIQETIEKGTST